MYFGDLLLGLYTLIIVMFSNVLTRDFFNIPSLVAPQIYITCQFSEGMKSLEGGSLMHGSGLVAYISPGSTIAKFSKQKPRTPT